MLASHFEDRDAAVGEWAEKHPAVYIMASRRHGTLYTGVTSALYSRVCDHKNEVHEGFTSRCNVNLLVWYEHHQTMEDAIRREKQIKAWKREWKIKTIEFMNPGWKDLHDTIDVTISLVSPKRDASMRWHDGD
jgi:putative endonuclease